MSNHGAKPWIVVFSSALFFLFVFIQLSMFNALDPFLIKAFKLNAVSLGQLSSTYFYGDVAFLFVAGILLDRFSTRKLLLITMGLAVVSTLGFALSHNFWQAAVWRTITGITAAFCLLSSVQLASRWFPPQRMALVIGLVVTMAMIGGMIAQAPFTWAAHHFGWREAMYINAALGVVFFIAILLGVQDFPAGYQAPDCHAKHLSFWRSIALVCKKPQNWGAGLYVSLMNLPILLLGAVWGAPFLVNVHHLTHQQASFVTMMLFIGMIVGSPLLGALSDKFKQRKKPMIWGSILITIVFVAVIFANSIGFWMLIAAFLLLGFLSAAQIIGYPLVIESNPPSLTGTAEGLASTLIMAGGLLQPVFGWLMQLGWDHKTLHGIPVYSAQNYINGIWMMAGAFVVSLIIAIFIRETNCRNISSQN